MRFQMDSKKATRSIPIPPGDAFIFDTFPDGVEDYQPTSDDDTVLLSGDYADFLASIPPDLFT